MVIFHYFLYVYQRVHKHWGDFSICTLEKKARLMGFCKASLFFGSHLLSHVERLWSYVSGPIGGFLGSCCEFPAVGQTIGSLGTKKTSCIYIYIYTHTRYPIKVTGGNVCFKTCRSAGKMIRHWYQFVMLLQISVVIWEASSSSSSSSSNEHGLASGTMWCPLQL